MTPQFVTERSLVRPLLLTDALAIARLRSMDIVNKYIDRPKQLSVEQATAFIVRINEGNRNNQLFYWALCLKENPSLIGTICLWNFNPDRTIGELGYELNPAYQHKGLMTEAIKPVIAFAFQTICLQKIEAFVHKDNAASKRLLETNNFKLQLGRKDESNPYNIIYVREVAKQK